MKRRPVSYYVLFLLRGVPERQVYAVNEETYDRLRTLVFSGGERPDFPKFICFETLDGWNVAIAHSDVQMAHFLWEPEGVYLEQSEEEEETPGEEVFFSLRWRNEPTVEIIGDTRDIYDLVCLLDSGGLEKNEFLFFQDEDDETVAINVDQLVWFRVPTEVVEDGLKETMGEGLFEEEIEPPETREKKSRKGVVIKYSGRNQG